MKWRPLCFFTLIEILFACATNAQEAPRGLPVEKPKLTPKVLVALPNYDEETSTRKLQIFLDNNYFGPGKIDGKMGEFFRKALVITSARTACRNRRGRPMADRPGA